jgi:hypothetical protein
VTTTVSQVMTGQSRLDPWGRDRAASQAQAELMQKLNDEARANWDSEAWHKQVAADLATNLDYGFQFENLFSTYIRTETVGEFDRFRITERRGLRVFFTSRGGYIDESQLRTEFFELPRDTMGFHVSEHIDKLRANFAETIANLAALGQQKMDAEVNRRILSLLQTAVPSTSPYYTATTNLAKAELDAAIRGVSDNVLPDGQTNAPVTVLGRAAMIDKISDFAGYSDEAQEEIRLRGRLGTYKGANLVVVKNWADEDGRPYLPANELWVIGGNAGRFVLYGGLQVKAWDENTVDYRHYRARRDLGGMIHHPEMTRRLVDSSVTP